MQKYFNIDKESSLPSGNNGLDELKDLRYTDLVMWSSDFHISPIADIKNIIGEQGVRVIDKSLSGHCALFKTCQTDLKVINKDNGLSLGDCPNKLREKFYNYYRKDKEFMSADAYICTHAASLCELFMPFNKSLIVIASTRYEIGRHDEKSWKAWNENLNLIAKNPHNIVAANNRYDQEYIRYFTGIQEVLLLPNLCGYIPPSSRYKWGSLSTCTYMYIYTFFCISCESQNSYIYLCKHMYI
jgi:hypothetical protein